MSTMSAVNLGANIAATLALFNWRRIALVTCSACFSQQQAAGYQGLGLAVKETLLDLKVPSLRAMGEGN
jgi:hypothetical protein